MAASSSEVTLLYGALAVELQIADRVTVARALDAWARNPSRSIVGYIDEQRPLDEKSRARIDEAVRDELDRHDNDPGRALATLPRAAELRASLSGAGWSLPPVGGDDDDPMATVADGFILPPPAGPEDSLTPTEAEPSATQFVQQSIPPGLELRPGSDINPIPSGDSPRQAPVASGSGSVPTPDLRPLSSIDVPSDRPSAGSGSEPPRFDPSATSGVEIGAGPAFDADVTSEGGYLTPTERGPDAGTIPETGSHDPMATSAIGLEPTAHGIGREPGGPIGAFGYSGTSSSRFRVVRAHAKGGLGAVMVAFDQELRREVALKEIQDRHADDPDSRARFLMEAEITGGLEHPGVVPVYSLGRNPDGRPFYAMRFIRGDSLRKAIDHFHDPGHGPRLPADRSLQLRALLRRFIDTCNALEYAHSRGVIHRDVKPDNIMLGPYGETLVVDWGLAKAVDRVEIPSRTHEQPLRPTAVGGSTPTLDGSAIGTPAFMSPEQAEGDLSRMGPASDIYSLGATLFQILTGEAPFREKNLFQILLKVRDGDFPPPRQLKPEVPPALEAICLTAMARSIEDRYDSCAAIADDLEHWLADEPVSVYREPWAVRLGRWAKRHRTIVASAGVLLVTAVVGLSIGSLLLARERDRTEEQRVLAVENEVKAEAQRAIAERNAEEASQNAAQARQNAQIALDNEREARRNETLALQNEERAKAQRAIAERNFQEAISAVDALLTEVGEIDLADVPQMEQTRRDLLLKARGFYERFLDQNDGPESRRDVGRARSRLGDIHELLGEYAEARDAYGEALAVQEPLAEASPDDPTLAADLARTRHNLAVLLKKLNEFEASEVLLDQARSARAELLVASPDDLDVRSDLASTTYQLGALLARLVGRQQEARDHYDRAIAMQREVVTGRDEAGEARRGLARYLNNLALLLRGSDPRSADDAFEESITLQRRLVEEDSDVAHHRRELARTLNNRVRDAIVIDPDLAEEPIREAIALAEQLTADYPKVPEYWSELGGYLRNHGRLLLERGRTLEDQASVREASALFRRARDAFMRAAEIREQLVDQYPLRPEFHHRLALVRHELATLLRNSGEAGEASGLLDAAVSALRELADRNIAVPEYRKDLALALSELAYATLAETDGLAKGFDIAREGLEYAESAANDIQGDAIYHDTLLTLHRQNAYFLRDLGRYRDLVEHARFLGDNASGNASWLFSASELYLRAAELAEADRTTPEQERDVLRDQYLGEAARLLEASAEAGFRSVAMVEGNFGPYRDREPISRSLEAIRENASQSR